MANELGYEHWATGRTGIFRVRSISDARSVWSVSGAAFETYLTANIANYSIASTEQGTASRWHVGSFPSAIAAGTYLIEFWDQAGGSIAESDVRVGDYLLTWTGAAVVTTPGDVVNNSFSYAVTTQASAFQYAIYYQGAGVKIRCTASPAAAIDLTDFVADIGIPGDYDSFTEANGGLVAVDESTGIFDINPTAAQSAAWPLQDTVINVWRNDSDDNRVPVIMGKLTMRSTLRGAS